MPSSANEKIEVLVKCEFFELPWGVKFRYMGNLYTKCGLVSGTPKEYGMGEGGGLYAFDDDTMVEEVKE